MVPRVRSRYTITRTAGGLRTSGFCECGTCVIAIAPRWCNAAEVIDDARPQSPSPNDEPYDACTETARDPESGTTAVLERDGKVCQRHVRRRIPPMTTHLCMGCHRGCRSAGADPAMLPRILA